MSVYARIWAYEQAVGEVVEKDGAKVWRADPGAKFVLTTVAEFTNEQGVAWCGQETIAQMTGMGLSTVRRHLAKLEDDYELIIRRERRRKDGTRTSDYIIFNGPKEAFRPKTNQALKSGGSEESTAQSEQNNRSNRAGMNRQVVDPSVKNTSKDVDAASPPSPGQFIGYLREELDGADVPLLRNREDRYAGEFNKLIKKGVSTDVLYKVCDRIVERWKGDEHKKLLAELALEDVVNGKPPAHAAKPSGQAKGTPQEVIEYILANARSQHLKTLRPVMQRWDFTSSMQPPYPVQKQLGGTENEAWANLNALQTLAKRALREIRGAA